MMQHLLEINNISKSFGDKVALKDVTFYVSSGSIVGFIGDNGAGKSTTFKTVLGLISKDAGTIKIFGKENFHRLVNSFSLPIDKKVKEFSRGMSMKLSIAVALSHHAKLLILDEATGGLDPSSREEVLDELKSFVSETNGGVLLSSHIMS